MLLGDGAAAPAVTKRKPASPERLELARRMLGEAEECLAKGDAVQASGELYKASEESIKALAEAMDLEEEGGWCTRLLGRAAARLSDELGVEVRHSWDSAYYLHVLSFHEAQLGREDVEVRVPDVRRLVELAERHLGGVGGTSSAGGLPGSC